MTDPISPPSEITYQLTKYEIARVIGIRATQIAEGAEPFIEVGNLIKPYDIAVKEFESNKLPIVIIRTLPNGDKILISLFQ